MALESGHQGPEDAGIPYDEIEQACVGYVYGESTCGQRAVYGLGLTGIPVYNVNNNCSTGSTALFMAKQLIEGGLADCVLALGSRRWQKGSLGATFMDRTNPMDKHMGAMVELRGFESGPPAAQIFGNAGREHMERYGTTPEQFAKIAHKNHSTRRATRTRSSSDEYTLDQILEPRRWCTTRSPSCSAARPRTAPAPPSSAARRSSSATASRTRPSRSSGMAMTTDFTSTFDDKVAIKLIGADMTKAAAQQVYEQSGLGPEDVDVIELHDCFSANELVTYEGLGLCGEGKARHVDRRRRRHLRRRLGRQPVGRPHLQGPPARRHRPGAVRRAELAAAGHGRRPPGRRRQASALQHNLGLGGAAVVTMYRK